MSYYPDLTPFEYEGEHFRERMASRFGLPRKTVFLNVGWLDSAYAFEKGEVEPEFMDTLFEAAPNFGSFFHRGYHSCPFCDANELDRDYEMVKVERGGRTGYLGSSMIVVPAGDVAYIAPNLIYHYIEAHGYRPPDRFHDAVMEPTWRRAVREAAQRWPAPPDRSTPQPGLLYSNLRIPPRRDRR